MRKGVNNTKNKYSRSKNKYTIVLELKNNKRSEYAKALEKTTVMLYNVYVVFKNRILSVKMAYFVVINLVYVHCDIVFDQTNAQKTYR